MGYVKLLWKLHNTPHAISKHLENVLRDLEQGSDTLLKWFTENHLKFKIT